MCGLKHKITRLAWQFQKSHPVWVCGLKLSFVERLCDSPCHTLYGCVDWNSNHHIKTDVKTESHPVWVCGLKPSPLAMLRAGEASHPVWVCGLKPCLICCDCRPYRVTPCMGVWIETAILRCNKWRSPGHTLYGCVDWNIKLRKQMAEAKGHTLYGCVDWNSSVGLDSAISASHPVWVCGLKLMCFFIHSTISRHTLYGCVDWNITLII